MPSSNELRLQRLDEEVRHLRSNVDHRGAETTQLRAEMARLKKLPAPPDARSGAPTAAGTGGDVRQWPAHLLPKPADKPAPPVMAAPVAEAPVIEAPTVESAKKDTAPAEPARDPKPDPEPDQERAGGKSEAEEKRIEPPVTQPVLATPVATEVDNAEVDRFTDVGTGSGSSVVVLHDIKDGVGDDLGSGGEPLCGAGFVFVLHTDVDALAGQYD